MNKVPKINLFKTAVQKVMDEKAQNPPESECETLNLESPNLVPQKRLGKSLVFALSTQDSARGNSVPRATTIGQFFTNLMGPKETNEQSPLKKNNKLQSIISTFLKAKKIVPAQKELGPEVIKHKFHRAFQIIRVMSRLYRISEDIQLYGTSSNLFDLTTRDRTRVRKILYTSVIDEAENRLHEEKGMKWFILHPKSKLRQIWSIVVIFMLTYTAIITPYRLTFEDDFADAWRIIDYFVDGLFFVDIVMNFVSAYYDEEGRLVKDIGTLATKYLKSWFLIDLLAVLPLDFIQTWFIDEDITQANLNTVVRLLRLPRLYRLVQLTRTDHIFKFIKGTKFVEWVELNSLFLKLIGFSVTVVSLMHIMACIWYFIAKMADNSDTWLVRNDLATSSNASIYVASLYYIFTTLATVGYGDISAATIPERLFSIVLMVLGVGFYSFTIALIANVLSSRENRESALKRKISIASEFADEIKAPRSLKMKIGQILEYNSFRNCFSWAGKRELFSEIPITLRYDIVMSMHNGILSSIPFFREHSDKYFVVAVAEMLKPLQINARDFLWKEGDSAESMYFLISGKVHLLSLEYLTPEDRINNVKGSIIFKRFMGGSYFGEIEIINKSKRSYALQATTDSELFYLTKHDYYNVLIPEFPHIHEELREIARERNKRNIESLIEIRNFLQAHIPEEKRGSRILTSRSNSNLGAKDTSMFLKPGLPHASSIEIPRSPQNQSKSFGPERKSSITRHSNILNSKNSGIADSIKRFSIDSRSPRSPSYLSSENLPPRLRKRSSNKSESIESIMSSFSDSNSLSSADSDTSEGSSSAKENEPSLVLDIKKPKSPPKEVKSAQPKTLTSVASGPKPEMNLLRVSRSKSFFTSPIIGDDIRRRRSIGVINTIKNAVIISSEEYIGKNKQNKSKEKSLLRLAAGLDTDESSSVEIKRKKSKKKEGSKGTRRISFAEERKKDKIIEVLKKSQKKKDKEKKKAEVLKKDILTNDNRLKRLEDKLQDLIQNVKGLID